VELLVKPPVYAVPHAQGIVVRLVETMGHVTSARIRLDPGTFGPISGATELDRLIHERIRLGIVSALAVNESLSFNELKALMKTTDGNLSVHARRLEEAQYVVCRKSFDGRVPRTEYRLTAAGRRALERYLEHMEALIKATRNR
jgi:DNA-binding HxlR family transcriptional regulator